MCAGQEWASSIDGCELLWKNQDSVWERRRVQIVLVMALFGGSCGFLERTRNPRKRLWIYRCGDAKGKHIMPCRFCCDCFCGAAGSGLWLLWVYSVLSFESAQTCLRLLRKKRVRCSSCTHKAQQGQNEKALWLACQWAGPRCGVCHGGCFVIGDGKNEIVSLLLYHTLLQKEDVANRQMTMMMPLMD